MKRNLYRICARLYSDDITGEGGKVLNGRWNYEGSPCIYLNDTPSRCLMECFGSYDVDLPDLVIVTYEVPIGSITTLAIPDLPSDWDSYPSPDSTREVGSRLLKENTSLLIEYPSAIFKMEKVYVLNPRHELMREVQIASIEQYTPPFEGRSYDFGKIFTEGKKKQRNKHY